MNAILVFLQANIAWILLILFVAGWLISSKIKGNISINFINFITQVEYGKLSKTALADTIEKIQRSDLDERMVLVMANAIKTIPFLNLLFNIIPRPIFIAWLNGRVQDTFNVIKGTLRGEKIYGDKDTVAPIVTNDMLEKYISGITDVIVKNMDGIIPKIENNDKAILQVTTAIVDLTEKVNSLQDGKAIVNDIKEQVVDSVKDVVTTTVQKEVTNVIEDGITKLTERFFDKLK